MRLKYHIAWAVKDLWPYLKWFSPSVQRVLVHYNGKLLAVSITPDGNRRFSRNVSLPHVVEWHKEWVLRIEDTILHLRHNRSNVVDEVTIWWLSRENKKRPEDELQWLYHILREFKPRLLEIADQTQAHIFMIGDTSLMPPDIGDLMADISQKTEQFNSVFRCALALGYDQEWETNRQADILIWQGFQWDQSTLRKQAFQKWHNWLREPDLMIRAGSEWRHRTSGGFMWPNTALHFFRAHWPTITTKHIDFALHSAIMEEINNGK